MVSARFRRHSRKAAKSFRNNMLSSQGCKVGFHLEVLSLQHILGTFKRKYTLLYKKVAKPLRNKRVILQHFGKCFLQLGVIGLQWPQLLRFNSELHTV
ncbi:hypothetical protein VitviT2T_002576 [Vitis vinifera]|uniref:Uncharacterized protein n=1 Tax=Vitis vinifera TaxID=29760 RepID=A0ABY9BJK7_VITVI|nr:hypothetical protein VitviT2T_002576 [Vitis vinifera]